MGLTVSIGREYKDIPASHWLFEYGLTVVGIFINSLCLWFELQKLKINVYIEKILLLSLGAILTLQSLGIVGIILMNSLAVKNLLFCSLYVLSKYTINLIAAQAAMSIAVVRHYLATTTARIKSINHTWIKSFLSFICFVIVGEASSLATVLLTTDTLTIGPVLAACSGRQYLGPELPTLIVMTMIPLACTIGIYYDLSLSRFLKERNKNPAPIEMAVWSSGAPIPAVTLSQSRQKEANAKINIPLKATLMGNIYLSLFIVAIGVFTNETDTEVSFTGAVLGLSMRIFCELYMSWMILFAIKSNKKKKASVGPSLDSGAIQPPMGLQFHDQS